MGWKDKIIDLIGYEQAEQPVIDQGEVGWAGSTIYSPGDFEKYNPDSLIARKGPYVYKKMMQDDQVKAVISFKIAAVCGRKWYFDVDEEDEQHVEMSDLFARVIDKIEGNFTDNLIKILSATYNGFSITEKVYNTFDYEGKTYWGIKALKLRPYESFNGGFVVDEHGNIEKINQKGLAQEIEIPRDKIIHFIHQPDIDEHYGESDLRACYRSWWSKDIIIKFQNIHLERHASGFIYAKLTKNIQAPALSKLKTFIENIASRTGAVIPDGVDLETFSPLRTDAYEKAIAQHDKAIAKSVLVPNLLGLTEQGATGSYAQASVHLQAFFWVLDTISSRLQDVLNDQLFRQLALWNFNTADYPRFTFEPISDEQKSNIAKSWADLVQKGAVTKSDSDEAHLRRLVGFPEMAEVEEDELPDEQLPGELPDEFTYTDTPWLRRVNFTTIKRDMDKGDQKYTKELNDLLAQGRLSLEQQIARIVGDRSFGNVKPNEFENVSLPKSIVSKIRKASRENLKTSMNTAHKQARTELPRKQLAKVIMPGMDLIQAERYLSSKSMQIARVIDADTTKAVQQVLANGIKYDKTLPQIIAAMEDDTALTALLPKTDAVGRAVNVAARLETIARTNISDAVNQGRQALFSLPEMKGFIQAYEYSAVLDDRTTEVCEHLQGKVLRDFGHHTPPNHMNCRSILIAVTAVDDWDGKESPKPRIEPNKGFG